MALATTCPQCKTSFKVIPDQLKLRRGLVRCGVCQNVFSGIDYLRYVDDSARNAAQRASPRGGGPQALPARMPESRSDSRSESRSASRPDSRPGTRSAARTLPSTPQAPQTIISSDEDLKTAFFLADSAFGPYSQTRVEDVQPPTSIRQADPTDRATSQDPSAGGVSGPATVSSVPSSDRRGDTIIGTTGIIDPADLPTETASDISQAAAGQLAGQPSNFAPRAGESAASRETLRTSNTREGRSERRGALARLGASDAQGTTARGSPGASQLFPPLSDDDDDPETRAANRLAREAREARRHEPGHGRSHSRRRERSFDDEPESVAEYFRPPGRRAAMAGLLVLLLLQTLLIFRDEIASGNGIMRPIVTTLAWPFGLTIYPVRDLKQLGIESFDIIESGEPDRLVLSAVLINRGDHSVRWPAMELTLTDSSRAVVVRKVITSAVYLPPGARQDGIDPRSERPIRLTLQTQNVQLAGYNVALFYP